MLQDIHKKAKVTELNDSRPVALTSVIMKRFERLTSQGSGFALRPMQLDPGLPDGPPPGGEGRKQNLQTTQQ
jgi:hypothetical protein